MTDPFDDPDLGTERPRMSRDPDGSASGPAASARPADARPADAGTAGSAFGPAAARYVPPSSQPQFGPSAHEFAAWLVRQPDFTPEFFEDTMNMFESVLVVMRDEGLRPDVPQHMEQLIQLMFADDAAGGADPDLFDDALASLDAYLHFRIENSRDPEEWEDVHDLLEEAIEARDDENWDAPLNELLAEEDPVPDDVKLRAYAELPFIRAVPDLLAWIGKGRAVTATGALRRADIEYVAGLLGIRAYGTNEPWSPRSAFDPDAPIAARSMSDVPLLDAWWEALQTAHVIERERSRVRPGPAAERASTGLAIDTAEEMIGYLLANIVTGSGWIAPASTDAAFEAIALLVSAVDPEREAPDPMPDGDPSLLDDVVDDIAQSRMEDLASMGLVVEGADGTWEVRDELRHVVARATVLAATLVYVDLDDED
ncbi:hypothetical protein [Microbacterium sp. 22242]|uniref:hypothetical protein n=1 Tax=Microbacterium sp. 22242 TaxID=3453896 RepID=UPI003F8709C3